MVGTAPEVEREEKDSSSYPSPCCPSCDHNEAIGVTLGDTGQSEVGKSALGTDWACMESPYILHVFQKRRKRDLPSKHCWHRDLFCLQKAWMAGLLGQKSHELHFMAAVVRIKIAKDQQPQICRRYHFNSRKWRGSKEPIDEDERGEWKSWLKTQHSKKDHGIRSYHFTANRWGKMWKQCQISFSWSLKLMWLLTAAMKLKDTCSLEEELWPT